MALGKPLLVEGHPGVGKTEIAKVLAVMQQGDLIRLQCYEGLDATTALYEWNYPKQLLHIRLQQEGDASVAAREADIFSERFLLKRPLLAAITHQGRPPVLLIDEVDRADEEFEAFLLEVLSDFQVTIPERCAPRRGPRSSSPRTAPVTSPMPFAAGACISGSTTRPWRRSCGSSGPASRASTSGWHARSPPSSTRFAA
jgi:hypothetical protein